MTSLTRAVLVDGRGLSRLAGRTVLGGQGALVYVPSRELAWQNKMFRKHDGNPPYRKYHGFFWK